MGKRRKKGPKVRSSEELSGKEGEVIDFPFLREEAGYFALRKHLKDLL
jgi:hypothetical protein